MSYADEAAQLFKERNNPKNRTPQVGEIKSVSPLKISLFEGRLILDDDEVLICSSLVEGAKSNTDIKIGESTNAAEITYKQVLVIGDLVLCIPAGQKFVVVDKVEVI